MEELVGKWVIRRKPAIVDMNSTYDWTFNHTPIKVEKATESHLYYRLVKDKPMRILDARYIDDAWIEVDPIYWK